MRYIKTYGARGVLEWQMMLRVGKARLRVPFTGGRMGSNGVVPAKYVTGSRAVQQLIERSRYFRCGKVYLHGAPIKIEEKQTGCVAMPKGYMPPIKNDTDESEERRPYQEGSLDDGGDTKYEC